MKLLLTFIMPFLVSYGWGFRPNNNHDTPDIGEKYSTIISNHNAYYVGDTNDNNIYLTFDTGYDDGNVEKILDILKEKNVMACFFTTGHFMKSRPDLILRMYNEGHIVGNHTYNHPKLTNLNLVETEEELLKVEKLYSEITNQEMKKYMRPPEGLISEESLTNTDKLGYKTILWSLAFKDWEKNVFHGNDYSYHKVINNIHNGAIILLHTVSKDNLDDLPMIIDGLTNQGYQFSSLDDL